MQILLCPVMQLAWSYAGTSPPLAITLVPYDTAGTSPPFATFPAFAPAFFKVFNFAAFLSVAVILLRCPPPVKPPWK